jgi:4'-phosphopantetheinyl transferase
MVEETWQVPPVEIVLAPAQVHLWRISLAADQTQESASPLSRDEQARADRFKFERDRRRFIASRSRLRAILAHYLDCDPAAIRFEYAQYGKPHLPTAPDLQFNLSHSGELALCAVTQTHRVGVDLEELRPLSHFPSLSQRCLSATELAALQQLPEAVQPVTFLQYWTGKEAYLKAIGKGLSESLQRVELQWHPTPQFCQVPEPGDWHLQPVNPGAGYVATAVAEGSPQFSYFDWSDSDRGK